MLTLACPTIFQMCDNNLSFCTNTQQHHFHFLLHQHPHLTKMPFNMIQPNLSTNKKQHESNKSSQTQAKSTTTTKTLCDHLLDYYATKPNVGLCYYASNTTIIIQHDINNTLQCIISCSSRS